MKDVILSFKCHSWCCVIYSLVSTLFAFTTLFIVFQHFTCYHCLHVKDWQCEMLHEINFLSKFCGKFLACFTCGVKLLQPKYILSACSISWHESGPWMTSLPFVKIVWANSQCGHKLISKQPFLQAYYHDVTKAWYKVKSLILNKTPLTFHKIYQSLLVTTYLQH